MKTTAFNKVKDQIGHCGIWCGSCAVGNGTLKELTTRYEKVIRDYDLENWAPKRLRRRLCAPAAGRAAAGTPVR